MDGLALRVPHDTDGTCVNRLVADCPPLDPNSLYCNLLQCTHFADTCVIAELDGEVIGFVSAYLRPNDPSVLFVWQVAVAEAARGRRLALSMLVDLLGRKSCADVRHLETSITTDNAASWRVFGLLADCLEAGTTDQVLFSEDRHFRGRHPAEQLLRIGPFTRRAVHAVRALASPQETAQ